MPPEACSDIVYGGGGIMGKPRPRKLTDKQLANLAKGRKLLAEKNRKKKSQSNDKGSK